MKLVEVNVGSASSHADVTTVGAVKVHVAQFVFTVSIFPESDHAPKPDQMGLVVTKIRASS